MDFITNLLLCDSMDLLEEALQQNTQILQQEINRPQSDGACQADISGSSGGSAFNEQFQNTANSANMAEATRLERKRKYDQEYRTRQREAKRKLESDYDKFGVENRNLKEEKDNLTREKNEMNEALVSTNNEARKLKRELSDLKRTGKHLEALVEFYSRTLLNEDHQQEVRDLKIKVEVISGNRDDWMMEKEHFLTKILDLEYQNKLLEVQNQALCSRIMKTRDEPY
ncbi:hypothetical protein ACFE04_029891 [Oxalis oulophora]